MVKKALLFLSFLAERFDRLYSLTYKKYLPISNQIHLWTEHVQSIVEVKNTV